MGLKEVGLAMFAGAAGAATAGVANAILQQGFANMDVVGTAGIRLAASGGKLVRGLLVWKNMTTNQFDKLMFPMNPEEISESITPSWAETQVPGQNAPHYQFINGGPREVSFTLNFFYGMNDKRNRDAVRNYIDTLRSLTRRQDGASYSAGQYRGRPGAGGSPPPLHFYLGQYFRGDRFIISRFEVRAFDLFDPLTLLPMRATVDLTLLEAETPDGAARPSVRLRDGLADSATILRAAL